MRSSWTKAAAAAVVLIALGAGFLGLWQNGEQTAYALEQTVEANHSVRSIHLKEHYGAQKEHEAEWWAEYDEKGNPVRLRGSEPWFPQSGGQGDGAKEMVWQPDRLDLWFKDKDLHVISKPDNAADQFRRLAEEHDPKLLVQRVHGLQAQGKVTVETKTPRKPRDPIQLTVTYLPQSPTPDKRLVIRVDPGTKLVKQIEQHRRVEGEYRLQRCADIIAYNKPIDPKTFVLKVPDGVMVIDQYSQDVGLAQGDLSDEEIAVKVVRATLEALIAENHAEAGRLMCGQPAEVIAERCRKVRTLRIISIGEAVSHPQWLILHVPVKIEVERDGRKETIDKRFRVRQVKGQPGRWVTPGS